MKITLLLLFMCIILGLSCTPSTPDTSNTKNTTDTTDANAENGQPKMSALQQALRDVRFVAYNPTQFNPLPEERVVATDETILADLRVLRPDFDGLITYSSHPDLGLDRVVEIASRLDYRAVILGIYDIHSQAEIQTAVKLSGNFPNLVVGILIGNEGITMGLYNIDQLTAAFSRLRELLPSMPLSTSEPIHVYANQTLIDIADFHTPNIHWWFSGGDRLDYEAGVGWVRDRIGELQARSDKPILVKEAALPSGPAPFATPEIQRDFFALLLETENTETLAIAFFEAYDAGEWKTRTNPSDTAAVEQHWGAFTNDRRPKPVVEILPKPK
jgi:exo-beta-1,3-glucanase (GH17 family)